MDDYTSLKTQKQIRTFTREIVNTIGICNDIKNEYPEYYKYFTTFLFPRHTEYPDKFVCMVNIGIRNNKVFQNKEVYIIKDDSSIDDVSVMRNCVTGKKADNLTIAMRNTIYPQIEEFKENCENLNCVICGSDKNPHIDHYEPQFIELKKIFLDKVDLKLPTKFDDNSFNGKIFTTSDNMFEKEWYEFHKKNATLRVLCQKCNLTRKKAK